MPSTPVNVKPMKLKPAALPRFSCSVPPIRNISRNGKTNAPMRRARSRRNLNRSRSAMAAIAFSSFISQDLQVGVFQRPLARSQSSQRNVEAADHLVRGAAVELHGEGAILFEMQLQVHELAPQLGAVGGVQLEKLLRRAEADLT